MRYTIGQAARAAGLTNRAVRLYETRGLLSSPCRTQGGYRLYTQEDLATLTFIRRGRALGLSLDGIAKIMGAAKDGSPCDRTRALLDDRLAEIDTAITELQRLRDVIVTARRARPTPASAGRCALIDHETSTTT